MALSFRTGYVDRQKNVQMGPLPSAMHYLRTWFAIDLVATFPFEQVAKLAVTKGDTNDKFWLKQFKMPRLLRVIWLVRRLGMLQGHRWIRMGMYMAMFMMLAHWQGCIWYFVG